jgi:hypothetical protein
MRSEDIRLAELRARVAATAARKEAARLEGARRRGVKAAVKAEAAGAGKHS